MQFIRMPDWRMVRTAARRAWIAVALAGCLGPIDSASAGSLMVVVDGSNSMWAEIDGVNKIVAVQDAIERALSTQDRGLSVGVVAYGAMRQNACSDVAVVAPPKGIAAEAAIAAVRAIRPKGASPVASALETAASVAPTGEPLSILLIADGTDNCGGDPVAAARRLAAEHAAIIHVIAFEAIRPDGLKALAPIAEATGGSFTLATTLEEFRAAFAAAEIAAAAHDGRPAPPLPAPDVAELAAEPEAEDHPALFTGSVEDGAGTGGPLVLAQAEVPMPRERPILPDPAENDPGTIRAGQPLDLLRGLNVDPGAAVDPDAPRPDHRLQLAARLVEGGEMIGSGVIWRIFKAQPGLDGTFELLEESEAPTPSFVLPADDYIVHVAYGLANTARRISMRDGPADEQIDLNAGGLRLHAVGALDEPLPDRNLMLSVYSSEQDEYGQRKLLVEQATPGKIIRLNAGTYHVVSRYGDANSVMRTDLRVQPGQLTDATIRHQAAEVTFKLVNEAGGEALANTAWSILSPGGDVVKESFGAFPSHVLASGEYSVVARHEGRLYSQDFSVEPGRDREVEIVAR